MAHSRRWLAYWQDRAAQRRVWAIALPLILSNISVPLVGLVDTAVIGQFGDAADRVGLDDEVLPQRALGPDPVAVEEPANLGPGESHPVGDSRKNVPRYQEGQAARRLSDLCLCGGRGYVRATALRYRWAATA